MKTLGMVVGMGLLIGLAACEPQPATDDMAADTTMQMDEDTMMTAMGDLPDTTGADLWAYLQRVDYQSWDLWPDKGQLYTGQEPHGMLLTTYLNDAAYDALTGEATEMPEGAIIVKENYMPDSTLAAITVMYKVAGYNMEHNDWFFSKHTPDGALDMSPDGMPLEGRVAGCQNCHSSRADNDYLMTADL